MKNQTQNQFSGVRLKEKKCKQCGIKFIPQNTLQSVCSLACAVEFNQRYFKAKRDRDWKEKKKELKEKTKTHSQWLNELQVVFNTYIRARDKNKGCISCGKPLTGKFDAGHYLSVGAYPGRRFDEDNVHGQCVECNQHKHGNHVEYGIRLRARISEIAFDTLMSMRNEPDKLTIYEIKEKIEHYKKLTKSLAD